MNPQSIILYKIIWRNAFGGKKIKMHNIFFYLKAVSSGYGEDG